MHITADQIAEWARGREAQGSLPRWIRRLVHTAGTPVLVTFPSGASINQPGWDGEVHSEYGSPWVPKGKSFWEVSCERSANSKANSVYIDRTARTSESERLSSAFVAVSARKWTKKRKWVREKKLLGEWGDIRAINADDLEQWLEQSPGVALQFGEELGLTGRGVESIQRCWDNWSEQCDPRITTEAFMHERNDARDRFIDGIRQHLDDGQRHPYVIRADSVDEATAFVCAALLDHPDLFSAALVVGDADGWRYVDSNPSLKVVVAAKPEIASRPTQREGLVVIIPCALGDVAGRSGSGEEEDSDLNLHRPKLQEFEKALVMIGLDEADARRSAVSSGRSWPVFRRLNARNPSIRMPVWCDSSSSQILPVVCLVAAWNGENKADREIVESVSGRDYEDIERDLQDLASMDDSPVLRIGPIWKAKSPLELLYLFGNKITSGELGRFFAATRQLLREPDPLLELEPENRPAAQVHGKVRPQSALVIKALCDTLVKLAVRGVGIVSLRNTGIEGRVAQLVRAVLSQADENRWLSTSTFLPRLAEASPEEFLRAVEKSLTLPCPPVLRLITETNASSVFGRCWHADLLWALETLAWNPVYLARVALVLTQLACTEIQGNWGNTPMNSLLSILRSWMPQTAATLEQRIALLDVLSSKEPDIAFDLFDGLIPVGQDLADPSARPVWRDDDAGAGHGVTMGEASKMVIAAADHMIDCSKGCPSRIARLMGKLEIFDEERVRGTLGLAAEYADASSSGEDRETIRFALRDKLHWHLNFNKEPEKALGGNLHSLEELYDNLAPASPVVRHRWLFSSWQPDVPSAMGADVHEHPKVVQSMRIDALREIHAKSGMNGVQELVASLGTHLHVGTTLAMLDIQTSELVEWIMQCGGSLAPSAPVTETTRGLLHASTDEHSAELIKAVLEASERYEWGSVQKARFLVLARPGRATWETVSSCGSEVEDAYWLELEPGSLVRGSEDELEYGFRGLLTAGRPRTALRACQYCLDVINGDLLAEILERAITDEEPDTLLVDAWHVGEAIDRLEESDDLPPARLVRLEFALIPALGFKGEQRAKALYHELMSDPKFFTDVLCLIYKPESGEAPTEASERARVAARIARRVLHACQRQPGTLPDGTVDEEAFHRFIDETRDLCSKADRKTVCDLALGQILAYAPVGVDDSIWPFRPARDVLDDPELEDIRRGFCLGTRNKRGVTTRALDEGGGQERKLAEKYRANAEALRGSHTLLAAALDNIARSYEYEGLEEDIEAQLRLEGY